MTPARFRASDLIGWSAAPPDYEAGLRAATATIVPLLLGELTGRPQLIWVALGGWLATFADPGGPYPLRASALLGFALAGGASALAGGLWGAHPWLSIAALFLWAAGCALLRVYGDAAGSIGSLALIAFAISLGSPAPLEICALRGLFFGAGTLWAAAMALALWPLHPYRPVRAAVSACHLAVAAHMRELAASPPSWAQSEKAMRNRSAIRRSLETARGILASVRSARRGETRRGELLVALYEAAELAMGDMAALSEALQWREQMPPWLSRALREAAEAFEWSARVVAEEQSAPLAPPDPPSEDGELGALAQRLVSHARLAVEAAAALQGGSPGPQGAFALDTRAARRSLRDALSFRSLELQHALRVATTCAAAALVGMLSHRPRWYWIVVTAVIVLQPHSGATLRRAMQRTFGTVAGAMLGALLAPVTHTPGRAALVLFALAIVAVALRKQSHAIYAALVTPLFVLMAESTSGDWHLTWTRVSSTLLGGGLALVGAYAFWPARERELLPGQIAALLRKVRAYLSSALAGAPSEQARREAGLLLANADAAFERFLDEPHRDDEVEALMGLKAAARRLIGAIASLSAAPGELHHAGEQLSDALESLAAASEARQAPPPLPPLPRTPQTERLVRPVEVIHSALSRFLQ